MLFNYYDLKGLLECRDETAVCCRHDFMHIRHRAFKLLDENKYEKYDAALEELEFMLISIAPLIEGEEILDPDCLELEGCRLYRTYAGSLFEVSKLIEFGSGMEVQWSEYFGLLALSNVWQATFIEKALEAEQAQEMHPKYLYGYVAAHAISGIEAVCHGENINTQDVRISHMAAAQAVEKISFERKRAAEKRNAPYKRLKKEFIQYYIENPGRSRADAARRFYSGLPKERQIYQSESHAERNLTAALRQFLPRQ